MPTPRQWMAHAVRRGSAVVLSMALATVSLPAQAQESLAKKVQKLYVEGQQKYDNQDYQAAATMWLEALELLEEKEGNQSTRQVLAIKVSEASIEAFHESMDVSILERALGALSAYAGEYRRVYGSEPSDEVQEAIRSLEHRLESAEGSEPEAEVAPATLSDDAEEPVGDKDKKKKRDKSGKKDMTGIGLIASGTTLSVLGMGGFGLMAVGMALGAAAEDDFINAPDAYGRMRAQDQGSTANMLAITGAIVGSVLLAAGIPMVVIGARKRDARAQMAVHFDPAYAGVSVGGRF